MRRQRIVTNKVLPIFANAPLVGIESELSYRLVQDGLLYTIVGSEANSEVQLVSFVTKDFVAIYLVLKNRLRYGVCFIISPNFGFLVGVKHDY